MTHLMKDKQENSLSDRKGDHIDLAFKAQLKAEQIDQRFYYEPMPTKQGRANLLCFYYEPRPTEQG